MKQFLELTRCERLGRYIVDHCATVRSTAGHFLISKSTVHKDVTVHLKGIDKGLYEEVREVLEKNKSERHLRGGAATKQKYKERQKRYLGA